VVNGISLEGEALEEAFHLMTLIIVGNAGQEMIEDDGVDVVERVPAYLPKIPRAGGPEPQPQEEGHGKQVRGSMGQGEREARGHLPYWVYVPHYPFIVFIAV
jgi:hypothetical protein